MGLTRFRQASGAKSGLAVRSGGDLPETRTHKLPISYLSENALVSFLKAETGKGRSTEKISWRCAKCGYTFEAEAAKAPPESCPSCKEKCEFLNVTWYLPECGLSGQDPRLG